MAKAINHVNPLRCAVCQSASCFKNLPVCIKCAPKFQALLSEKCRKCGKSPQQCTCNDSLKIKQLMFYRSPISKWLMYGYKYHGDIRSIGWMAILAARAHKIKFSRFDGITYVPRSKSGIKRYGYDQSLAAAEAISKKFGVPLLHLLENKGDGEQKLLSRNQRMKNIRSRFALKNIPSEKYKKILLVDDISTTGATVGACAALLREEAASSVVKLVISKTVLLK